MTIPEMRKRVAPITIERYHQMIDLGIFEDWDVELLNGGLVEKMSKPPLHASMVRFLFRLLGDGCPPGCFVTKEDPITLTDSEPEPDLAVIEGKESDFTKSNPTTALLIIEVKTEVYRKPVDGKYDEKGEVLAETPLDPTTIAEFSFQLAEALAP